MYFFRTNFINTTVLAINILIAPAIYGSQPPSSTEHTPHQIAFAFDIDDVISGKPALGNMDYATLIPRMMYWHPFIITALLPANYATIEKCMTEVQTKYGFKLTHFSNLANELSGSSIVHDVLLCLKDNGYGDALYYEQEIIERAQKPYPVEAMIENIKKLKEQGYTIIGATNQDFLQHTAYRKYLRAHYGIDLNTLFDAVINTRVNHIIPPAGCEFVYQVNTEDHIYMMCKLEDRKPTINYFKAVEHVIKTLNPTVTEIIYTDDSLKNCQGAEKVGFKTIHFNLPGGIIRNTTPADLQKTIQNWKTDLNKDLTEYGLAATA